MVTIRVVVQRALLVNNPDSSLLRPDADVCDVVGGLSEPLQLAVEDHGGFTRRLGVEFGWVGDLEEHILHHVRAVRALELERLRLEEHVVETPSLGRQDGRDTAHAFLDHQCEVDGAGAGVTRSPRLSRHGVRDVAVGAE